MIAERPAVLDVFGHVGQDLRKVRLPAHDSDDWHGRFGRKFGERAVERQKLFRIRRVGDDGVDFPVFGDEILHFGDFQQAPVLE